MHKLSLSSWLNKQTDVKGKHNFILLDLCGGPCHLCSFKQGSWDLLIL